MNDSFFTYHEATMKLTLAQKVGQLFMPAAFINDTEEEVQSLEHLIRTQHIGAICFFHSRASAATNFEGKKKVVYNENSYDRLKQLIDRYQKAAKIPLLIAIDAEWGLAMRIENTPQYPYAITLGAIQGNEDLIEQVGWQIGMDCLQVGIHWNLSPVADINNNPENPVIGYRSFGDHKEKVLSKTNAYLKGMTKSGILNSIKHFPGHGDTATDSHLGLPVIDKSKQKLLQNELYPFKVLIDEGVDSVMVGHLSVPALDDSGNPATTSYPIITELLRNELGFEGVVISDALNMHAVSKNYPEKGTLEAAAFHAGMDMMCFSENPPEGISQILSSAAPDYIEASFKRIWALKEKAFSEKGKENNIEYHHNSLNKKLAKQSLTSYISNQDTFVQAREGRFLNLSVGNPSKNLFSQKIENAFDQKHVHLSLEILEDMKNHYDSSQKVVLAIFPPAVKPKDNFGFSSEILHLINEILSLKNSVVYLFGNPYVLDILDCSKASELIIVYQNFQEFQEIAFEHFIGNAETPGKLPVQLKTLHL
ncbi:MAG: glycoside hydrolase family 3 protein [Bacteroidota bacterium]